MADQEFNPRIVMNFMSQCPPRICVINPHSTNTYKATYVWGTVSMHTHFLYFFHNNRTWQLKWQFTFIKYPTPGTVSSTLYILICADYVVTPAWTQHGYNTELCKTPFQIGCMDSMFYYYLKFIVLIVTSYNLEVRNIKEKIL